MDSLAQSRFSTMLLTAFGAIALHARGDRRVRRHLLRGGAAHPGDRDPHGAGRAPRRRAGDGRAARRDPGRRGPRRRPRGGPGAVRAAAESALPGEPDRPADVRGGPGGALDRGACSPRRCPPGAPPGPTRWSPSGASDMALAIDPLIRLDGISKIFHTEEVETHALSRVEPRDPGRRVRRDLRPVRLRQDHAALDARSARLAQRGELRARGRAGGHALAGAAGPGPVPGHRLHLPGLQSHRRPRRVLTTSSCRSSTAGSPRPSAGRWCTRRWSGSVCCTGSTTTPRSSPAASSSAWRWPARWRGSRSSCWPTSPPAISTPPTAPR